MSAPAAARRPDLDWIRVIAFGLLILYHVGMFYVPWGWHVKSPRPVEWLEPVMMLTNPWRLTLLFLVSGAATRFMADRISPGELAKTRLARLAPPLIVAVLLIVPPQTYLEIVEKLGFGGGYADFYRLYLSAQGGWRVDGAPLITPTYNHMWFVAYLLVYSLILAALLAVARTLPARLESGMDQALRGWRLLAWPALALVAMRVVLAPMFEVTHALVDDWYTHAVSFSAFAFGYLMARSDRLRAGFIALRRPALAAALVGYGIWASYAWAYRGEGADPAPAMRLVGAIAYGVEQWGAIVAALGFGARHLTRGGPVLRYLTLGVFPFYIIHQTLIVVAAHHLARLGLPQALEAAILIATTFAGCLATYEAARRISFIGPLFGLKAQAAPSSASPRPA